MLNVTDERILLSLPPPLLLLFGELRQALFDRLLLLLQLDLTSLEGMLSIHLNLPELLTSLKLNCF